MKRYLSVAIENSAAATDRLYTYICRDDSVGIGDAVQVPFGRGSRKGFVFAVSEKPAYDESKLKEILRGEGNILSPEAVELCRYMKSECFCRYTDGVRCFIPPGYFSYEDILTLGDREAAAALLEKPGRAKKLAELAGLLLSNDFMKKSELKNVYGIGYDTMKRAVASGLAVQGRAEKKRRPMKTVLADKDAFIKFTPEQSAAYSRIKAALDSGVYHGFLLYGVTGSGKTRVYIEAIREALRQGKTAIILVPEISLTIQSIERFRGEFGDLVAVLHSRLSDGERYDEWTRIKRGEAKVVLGVRSAVFAPLENIGVIAVDEEHESSYKADNSPRYDAVSVAEERARLNGGVLILGSATPQVTTFRRSEEGELERLTLRNRYNDVALPKVHVADMREELRKGNRSIFSEVLYRGMKKCLSEGRQIILFLNRRGYSSFISCRNCGFVMKCPDCGVSLTYHKSEGAAVCHYCGRSFALPSVCPDCGSPYIKDFGVGTERVEEICRKYFPEARVGRLDLDTMTRKGSAEEILSDFKNKKTDILIGTQLVAKGLDYDTVDLVGIIAADISLNIPDYRSAEKTFQLITQAAGRSGRGEKQGKVVIQTYNPDHYAVKAASRHDYEAFYREEIRERQAMTYPPFGNIIRVVFADENEGRAGIAARTFCEEAVEALGPDMKKNILGPNPTHIVKIRGRYRYQVLVKYKDEDFPELSKALEEIKLKFSTETFRSCRMTVEVNPYNMI